MLTEEQINDAKDTLGISEFVYLPSGLQRIWSNIPADGDLPIQDLNKIIEFLKSNARKDDYVLIQGEFGATFYIVDYCFNNSLLPVYSTTARNTVERISENGEIEKVSCFKHKKFRKYLKYR